MKFASFIFFIVITSCSSNRIQDTIPPYESEKVCSDKALKYLNIDRAKQSKKTTQFMESELYPRMLSLEPAIRNCYEDEMARTNKNQTFNLCFVVGFDQKEKMEFFEFSTKEISLTDQFKGCLAKLRVRDELKGLRNVVIEQAYRLQLKPQ
jgi:hypothetical protein